MKKTEHDIVADGVSSHNGEYWYRCTKCGMRDWIASYGTQEQLTFYHHPCNEGLTNTESKGYTDIISDGGMDPRNKNDQPKDEMVVDYLIEKVQELMKLKPENDREFDAVNSIIHSFIDVIWWMQNKK